MPLSYLQKDQLASNADFKARIRSALREIAAYFRDLAGNATEAQANWSKAILEGNAAVAVAENAAGEVVAHYLLADAELPAAANITDANIKAAVEAIAVKYRV